MDDKLQLRSLYWIQLPVGFNQTFTSVWWSRILKVFNQPENIYIFIRSKKPRHNTKKLIYKKYKPNNTDIFVSFHCSCAVVCSCEEIQTCSRWRQKLQVIPNSTPSAPKASTPPSPTPLPSLCALMTPGTAFSSSLLGNHSSGWEQRKAEEG